ncbi:uncharacterized protein LOC8259867 isoform X2 [Ricinus communis]|uniref:uncharacterized protein LOC8259867 isoform X2 n=1 Tax=Ricinus communis TaxID=3988 RepID=UPI0007727034|nr:uncharacterized protein LOC8259867 isoform X2 [Ricinus communis]|eukprot:XP_015577212.1 uncharacterized protein LOC8259867 isoform X2 [Ricinus communis]
MSHRSLDSRHSIDSCTFQLHSWRPFHLQTLDSDPPKPYSSTTKRPCLSDRTTSFPIDSIDISKLSIIDDDKPISVSAATAYNSRGSLRLIARKRRRRGSRSVSGRSSDRSGTRRCCSVGAHGTCSDFPVAVGTDSSGELFGNGDSNWGSDVSEAKNSIKREKDREREEKENMGYGQFGTFENQGNESGYGSEPGYRGDAEFGYEDEIDEEEDDAKLLFWGDHFGGPKMEMVGENSFSDQKSHHRCRRKKHDNRMLDSVR